MLIENEINSLNSLLIKALSDENNQIADDISDYLKSKSKRIRPSLIFLMAKAMDINISEKVYNLAVSVELVHNSTLVHDDILDNAETRRGKISLNYKLGNSLSVLAGDILLSVALKELAKCENAKVIETFAHSLYLMCKGEINQNFAIDNLPSMQEYIDKSEHKTAELFKAPLTSLAILYKNDRINEILNFAINFGIAFQIKDDLMNILQTDPTKPQMSDIQNGIYTAPVIFLNQEHNIENLSKEDIIKLLKENKKYTDKTSELIKEYVQKAIDSLSFIPDNIYKQEIIRITQNLCKAE
jgi:geranylgeranyl pyrophosphate synthase